MSQKSGYHALKEVTPLMSGDCFTITSSCKKKEFDIPLHYHDEYELTLILNAKGAKRVVGNNIGIVDDDELVFIGPNVYHSWFTHQCTSNEITEITIQFHKDLFDGHFLERNQLCLIRKLLNSARLGVLFPKETVASLAERIINLKQKLQFGAVLELLSILHSLSFSTEILLLSDPGFSNMKISHKSRRIEKVFEFIYSSYEKHITLAEAACLANMPAPSFSRFFKRMTGTTFIESLNDIRLGHASRMLVTTGLTISFIAYECGFNNISNFNRIFKRKKRCTPREFRDTYSQEITVYV